MCVSVCVCLRSRNFLVSMSCLSTKLTVEVGAVLTLYCASLFACDTQTRPCRRLLEARKQTRNRLQNRRFMSRAKSKAVINLPSSVNPCIGFAALHCTVWTWPKPFTLRRDSKNHHISHFAQLDFSNPAVIQLRSSPARELSGPSQAKAFPISQATRKCSYWLTKQFAIWLTDCIAE